MVQHFRWCDFHHQWRTKTKTFLCALALQSHLICTRMPLRPRTFQRHLCFASRESSSVAFSYFSFRLRRPLNETRAEKFKIYCRFEGILLNSGCLFGWCLINMLWTGLLMLRSACEAEVSNLKPTELVQLVSRVINRI